MRKLVLSLAVIAAALTGCNKDESAKAYDGLTANIAVAPSVNETAKKSGDVNRGTIPVYVKTITVKTTSTTGNGHETSDDFTLVDDNSGEGRFIIKDVPFGERLVEATTTSNNNMVKEFRAFGSTLPEIFAVYEGSKTAHIDNNTGVVKIDMNTNNGRVIVSMEATQDLLDKDLNVRVSNGKVQEKLDSNGKLIFVWQGDDAVDGATTNLKFEWFTKTDGAVQFTQDVDFAVVAGESKTYNVTLNAVAIDNIAETEVAFKFVKVKDTHEDMDLGVKPAVTLDDFIFSGWPKKPNVTLTTDYSTGFVSGVSTVRSQWTKNTAVWMGTKDFNGVELKSLDVQCDVTADANLFVNVYVKSLDPSVSGSERINWYPQNQSWDDFIKVHGDRVIRLGANDGSIVLRMGDSRQETPVNFTVRKWSITRK